MNSKLTTIFKDKLSLETIYLLVLIIICIVYAIGIIPTGFHGTDDARLLERVQSEEPFIKNVFKVKPLAGSYYRPLSILIWGICYDIFGLWSPGYNIVEFFLYLGIVLFFYKSVSLLSNCTIAFIASLFLLMHTASNLLSWLNWSSVILELLFVWLTLYFIIRNSISNRSSHLFFIVCGTVLAILSREAAFVSLLVIFSYYVVFEKPDKKLHRYVYGSLIAFILLMMAVGPSGAFRNRSGLNTTYVLKNLHLHLGDIVYLGFPILLIPFLFSIVIFVRDRNIYKSFTFYLPTSVILIMYSQIPDAYGGDYINDYLFGLLICTLILIWRRYVYTFVVELYNKKGLIWYLLFFCTFLPILSFYLPTRPYHYMSFPFLLTAFAVTYYIWSDKLYAALSHEYIGSSMGIKELFSPKTICVAVIVFSLALNSFKVVYHNLNVRKAYASGEMITLEKMYRNARANLFDEIADSLIHNSESNSLVITKENSPDINYEIVSDNSRFLFIHIRHKVKNFKIVFNPDFQMREYSSDFKSILALLDLDPKISFDPETEKYIMGKVGENHMINSSFEDKSDRSLNYSKLPHSGNLSMVLMKESYPERAYVYQPDSGSLTLKPGSYLFGGYYKSENLSDNALFEIIDSRGYKAGRWHSNTISGSTEWKLLRGKLYLKEKSEVLLRPLRIDNFHSGKVFVDDLFGSVHKTV